MTRVDIRTQRMASFVTITPPSTSVPAPTTPHKPDFKAMADDARRQARVLQANIDELFTQKGLTQDMIQSLIEQRKQIMIRAKLLPFADEQSHNSSVGSLEAVEEGRSRAIKRDQLGSLLDMEEGKSRKGKQPVWPLTAGEKFLAAKNSKELEEFAKTHNYKEIAEKVMEIAKKAKEGGHHLRNSRCGTQIPTPSLME
jgi:hypothetical protein